MSPFRRHLALGLALATCTSGVLAACGDDDDSAEPAATTAASAQPVDADGPSSAFCDAYVDITLAMSGEPDPEVLTTNIEIVEESAPEEIAASLTVMVDAVRSVLDSNGTDFSAMEAPEFAEAQGEVDPYVFERCEFDATLEVAGADFEFTGLPETVPSGRVAILFTNEGAEAHEIAVMRKNDGVTEDFEALLQLPEEQAMEKVAPVGGAFAPTTGSSGLLIGDFEPGEYIALCFVPTGTVVSEDGMTEGQGEPHFMHGMSQEFTVEA